MILISGQIREQQVDKKHRSFGRVSSKSTGKSPGSGILAIWPGIPGMPGGYGP